MDIIRKVAVLTLIPGEKKFVTLMAALAGGYGVHALQRKFRQLMIETVGFTPASRLVTAAAVIEVFRFMDIVRAVAGFAFAVQRVIQ